MSLQTNAKLNIMSQAAEQVIENLLPHGSGIDYDWKYEIHPRSGKIKFLNAFHAMNENGMYCHIYPFSFTLKYDYSMFRFDFSDWDFKSVRLNKCCGEGLGDYLADVFDSVCNEGLTYKYIIDLDERGIFKAHVEDFSEKIIFSFDNEDEESNGALWIVEDGFMKHCEDVDGLKKYMKETNRIPKDGKLIFVG